jgi:hypothetical protein
MVCRDAAEGQCSEQPGTDEHCVRLNWLHDVGVPLHVTVPPLHVQPGCVVPLHCAALSAEHGVTVPVHAAEVDQLQPDSPLQVVALVFELQVLTLPEQVPDQVQPVMLWHVVCVVFVLHDAGKMLVHWMPSHEQVEVGQVVEVVYTLHGSVGDPEQVPDVVDCVHPRQYPLLPPVGVPQYVVGHDEQRSYVGVPVQLPVPVCCVHPRHWQLASTPHVLQSP